MSPSQDPREVDRLREIDALADEFETAFHGGENPRIEAFLPRVEPGLRPRLLKELLQVELEFRARYGETFVANEYLRRFPQARDVVQLVFESWADRSLPPRTHSGGTWETQPSTGAGRTIAAPGRLGRFELQRHLGTGGFGSVFLAHDTRLGRSVALKIPHSSEPSDSNRRFQSEARAAAKLKHPNIVTVYDSDLIDGTLYIACEFIDGGDLSRVLKERKVGLKQLVAWLRDAARALAYAHEEGVIHRDVKPGNLLVSRSGQIYVSDFGLARRIDDDSSLTATGTVLGTPAYMAPEQAAGLTASIGPATDQYSLGVVLYEVLTGRVPFRGNLQQVLQKVTREPPKPPRELNPNVPPELEAICLRALAKNPAHRYPRLEDFAQDLDNWLQGMPIAIGSAAGPAQLWRLLQQSKTARLFATAIGLVVLVGGGLWVAFGRRTPPPTSPLIQANINIGRSNLPGQQEPPSTDPPGNAALQPPTASTNELLRQQQRSHLLAASTPERSWDGSVTSPSGTTQGFVATFLDRVGEGESITLLMTDPLDKSRRRLWTGGLQARNVVGHSRRAQDLWVLAFTPLAGDDTFPLEHQRQAEFVADDEGRLVWRNLNEPVRLEPHAGPLAVPTVPKLTAQIRAATAPGQVWEGTLQEPGEASRRVRVTFTSFRDDGQNVRAVLEAVDSPYSMAPFVGTIDWNPAALLAGRPIRLLRQAAGMGTDDSWKVFTAPYLSLELQLALTDDGGLQGVVGRGEVKLAPAPALANPTPQDQQWRAAIQPGAQWSGVLRFRDNPNTRVNITIAEVRDDHSYLRLLAEDAEDPHRFAVYEGAINFTDNAIDGFALDCAMKARGPRLDPRYNGLFGNWGELPAIKHAFRLSPDGQTLYCRTGEGERIALTRAAEPVPLPLDRTAFAETWKSIVVPNQGWQGTVHNTDFDQKTVIRLDFLGRPDDVGNVKAMLSVVNQSQVRMLYTGTLRTEGDATVNAFALKLAKGNPGQGPSILFGTRPVADLHLRLSSDGQRLIGMAGADGRWSEFLELTETSTAR